MHTSTRDFGLPAGLLLPLLLLCAPGCAGSSAERRSSVGGGDAQDSGDQAIQTERIDAIQLLCNHKASTVVPRCWSAEYERTHNRKLAAQVTLQIMVAPDGTAQDVRVTSTTGSTKELDQCLVDEAKNWSYPEGKVAVPAHCSFFLQSSM